MHSSSVYSRKTCPRSVGGPAACRLHAVSSIARAASRTTALRAAATSESQTASGGSNGSPQRRGPKAVVVGGGWAGFGAAYALSQAGADVTVLDAAEQPGGLASSWKSQGGKTVEPGIKG